jgi:hypothetical protein
MSILKVALLALTYVDCLGIRKGLSHESVFGTGSEHEERIKRQILEAGDNLPEELTI